MVLCIKNHNGKDPGTKQIAKPEFNLEGWLFIQEPFPRTCSGLRKPTRNGRSKIQRQQHKVITTPHSEGSAKGKRDTMLPSPAEALKVSTSRTCVWKHSYMSLFSFFLIIFQALPQADSHQNAGQESLGNSIQRVSLSVPEMADMDLGEGMHGGLLS